MSSWFEAARFEKTLVVIYYECNMNTKGIYRDAPLVHEETRRKSTGMLQIYDKKVIRIYQEYIKSMSRNDLEYVRDVSGKCQPEFCF